MRLAVENLGKRYDEDTWGIREITLELDDGVHGLLGPNGAGKSTLMKILATVMTPTTGNVTWDGTDAVESPGTIRSVLGYLPQDVGVYPDLTPVEFLDYVGALRGLDAGTTRARTDELLALTNLADVRDRKLRTFSGGMRQRVGIAQALLNDPELLVVDEPTVGLDPEERVRLRSALANAGRDRVVVLSTHIVPDVESTAETVALLDDGRLIAHAPTADLVGRVEGDVYECVLPQSDVPSLRERHTVCQTVERADGVEVRLIADDPPADADPVPATLEDAYLDAVDAGDERR